MISNSGHETKGLLSLVVALAAWLALGNVQLASAQLGSEEPPRSSALTDARDEAALCDQAGIDTSGSDGVAGDRVAGESAGILAGAWQSIGKAPIPGRFSHTAVWSGDEVIFWGGGQFDGPLMPRDGAAYDPLNDKWRKLPEAPIRGRVLHSAVWTGTEMIVWGGQHGRRVLKDGAAYDPARDRWHKIAAPKGEVARHSHHVAWTGEEMIVWSGYAAANSEARADQEGLAYDPVANTWRTLPRSPLGDREFDAMTWKDDRLIVVGHGADPSAETASYDPVQDAWSPLPAFDLSSSSWATPYWTGIEVPFITPGRRIDSSIEEPSSAVYRPAETCWWIPGSEAPANAATFPGVWGDGAAMFAGPQGVAYEPKVDRWLSLPRAGGKANRDRSPVVWAGDRLVMWGGSRGDGITTLRRGAMFVPS